MPAYDDFVINGRWHICECGLLWSDSDGGPCHIHCTRCGKLKYTEDFSESETVCDECIALAATIDKEEFCPECFAPWDIIHNRCTAQCNETERS